MTGWWERLNRTSLNLKVTILAVIALWLVALLLVTVVVSLFMERSGKAQIPEVANGVPAIWLEPDSGSLNTLVTVRGESWQPERTVLIRLAAIDETAVPGYGLASTVVDAAGRFETSFLIPLDPRWEGQAQLKVIAYEPQSGTTVPAFYNVVELPSEPTAAPTGDTLVWPTPTMTPTLVIAPPSSIPESPDAPLATATADVNIRRGPGTAYAILGLLRSGQSAEVTAVSLDGDWWQINFAGSNDGRGWVSARYVTTHNTGNVPVAQPPALPQPPAQPPVVIRDWRGEYFSNPDLSGSPALVRNDAELNFDWGTGGPAAGLKADRFCYLMEFLFKAYKEKKLRHISCPGR